MRAAIVGVGFMGWIHYLAYQRSGSAQLVGFCSRDAKKRAGDWRGIQGNFGPPGEQIDVSGMKVWQSYEEVLADPDVDLVDLCLPPHLHDQAVRQAFDAGKHVLCEKPLVLTGDAAIELTELAERAGRRLLVGHVLPFMAEFQYLAAAAADGRFGRLLGGSFKRVIGPVDWNPDFYDPQRVGGPMVDLFVHDTHLIRLLFGMPRQVIARGRMRGEVAQYFDALFLYDDPQRVVSGRGGVIDQPGRPFTHGFEAHFEQATLQFESAGFADGSAEAMPLKVLHQDGRIERPDLGPGDPIEGFVAELQAAAQMLAGGPGVPALDGRLAADALVLCQRLSESIQRSEPVAL